MVCATARDRRELGRLEHLGASVARYHGYASDDLESMVAGDPTASELTDPWRELESLLELCEGEKITAVASTDDYPGSALAAIVAHRIGVRGVRPEASLTCQHKFHSRRAQQRACPDAVPEFYLIDARPEIALPPQLTFPTFVKPIKSYLSLGAQLINDASELRRLQREWLRNLPFFNIFDEFLRRYTPYSVGHSLLLAERPLSGVQVTLDGYVYDGEVVTVGVVDSIMYPGTLAFQRFEYPSALPAEAQQRMSTIAGAVMAELGYGDGQFNMEFMFDPETERAAIIEINPRMSSQFADLYEKVDGTNGYATMLSIARGVRPVLQRRAGRHRAAASCVLRTFKNQMVMRVPTAHEIERLQQSYPDLRIEILAQEGTKLSQQLQDGNSYRYAVLNIGAGDRREILDILEDCRRRLTFIFEPV